MNRRHLFGLLAAAPLVPAGAFARAGLPTQAWSGQPGVVLDPKDGLPRTLFELKGDGTTWFDWPAVEEMAKRSVDTADRDEFLSITFCQIAVAARQAGRDER